MKIKTIENIGLILMFLSIPLTFIIVILAFLKIEFFIPIFLIILIITFYIGFFIINEIQEKQLKEVYNNEKNN